VHKLQLDKLWEADRVFLRRKSLKTIRQVFVRMLNDKFLSICSKYCYYVLVLSTGTDVLYKEGNHSVCILVSFELTLVSFSL
jgi:hypothetical protein